MVSISRRRQDSCVAIFSSLQTRTFAVPRDFCKARLAPADDRALQREPGLPLNYACAARLMNPNTRLPIVLPNCRAAKAEVASRYREIEIDDRRLACRSESLNAPSFKRARPQPF